MTCQLSAKLDAVSRAIGSECEQRVGVELFEGDDVTDLDLDD